MSSARNRFAGAAFARYLSGMADRLAGKPEQSRKQRLARQLRENLKRRKAQARQRGQNAAGAKREP
jgi:hypothetical protein